MESDRNHDENFKKNIKVSNKREKTSSKTGCGQLARSLDTKQNFS